MATMMAANAAALRPAARTVRTLPEFVAVVGGMPAGRRGAPCGRIAAPRGGTAPTWGAAAVARGGGGPGVQAAGIGATGISSRAGLLPRAVAPPAWPGLCAHMRRVER
jgi:hypothetical protein